jgi:hypothetical protein
LHPHTLTFSQCAQSGTFKSWLVAGIVPGVERQPLKKLAVDEIALVKLIGASES